MSQIAIVGSDGAISIVDVDTSEARRISPQGVFCTWPTWSPNGRFIAYSGHRSGSNGNSGLRVIVYDIANSSNAEVYINESGTDAIARGTPHYFLWSPDSSMLAFICQTWSGGLTLFLYEVNSQRPATRILDGGPLYISWSPDSRFLMAHSGQLHYLINSEDKEPAQVPVISNLYMAPSWNSETGEVAICGELSAERQSLLVANTQDDSGARMLTEIDGAASLAWRPGGNSIALARNLNRSAGYYGGLWLIDNDSEEERQLTDDPVLSFFWSPNGERIAYISTSEMGEGSIRWAVLEPDVNQTRYYADFRPSQEQLTTFMFFDQYGQSHSPWSPDSRQLTFSGIPGLQEVRVPLPEGALSNVYTLDIQGDEQPAEVGRGILGVWSRT